MQRNIYKEDWQDFKEVQKAGNAASYNMSWRVLAILLKVTQNGPLGVLVLVVVAGVLGPCLAKQSVTLTL